MHKTSDYLNKLCGCDFMLTKGGGDAISLSLCFETLVLVVLPFAALAGTSAYLIGSLRPPDVNLRLPGMFLMRKNAAIFTCLIAGLALAKNLVNFTVSHRTPVLWISDLVRVVSLAVHSVYLHRLSLIHFEYLRGPVVATVAWALTVPFYGSALERVTVAVFANFAATGPMAALDAGLLFDLFAFAAQFACQCCYAVTLMQKNKKFKTVSIISSEDAAGAAVGLANNFGSLQNLLYNVAPTLESGAECPSREANCISRLFFHWVQPLMSAGRRYELSSPLSAYRLPRGLETKSVCERFSEKLNEETTHSNGELLGSYSCCFCDWKFLKCTVFRALTREYGKWFVLCGGLKFCSSVASFAAPILLYHLVDYVSSESTNVASGCLFAFGLFLSAFFQCVFGTHFSFQVIDGCVLVL